MTSGPRWLRELVEEAGRAGVPLRSASAHAGVLRVTLGAAGRGLEVEVKPRAAAERYFVTSARFGLCYRGPARLPPARAEQLRRLAEVLRRLEPAFPEVLEARVGVEAPAPRDGTAPGGAALPYCTVERSVSPGGERWTELLVRLTSRCNQDCPFCSGPPPHAEPTLAAVLAYLDAAVPRLPRPLVTLTGGEPTLWPELRELAERLLGRPELEGVKVQTNAVGFAEPRSLESWPRSERLSFFVSFHGARAEIYDRCTGSPGQLERAVAGINNLLAAGHAVVLNLVANRDNADHLEEWVRAVPRLFAPAPPRIHFSITMCPEHRASAPESLVRYTELGPRLEAAAALAATLGVTCESLLSSSHASIPACLIAADLRVRGGFGQDQGGALPLQRQAEIGIEDLRKPWVKSHRCERCSQGPWCLGLPRAYVRRFGLDELQPITYPGSP